VMKNLCDILREAKTIAVVGISRNRMKTSTQIAEFLALKGYRVVGVNPRFENPTEIPVYSSLRQIPFEIDIVDVFRPSEDIPEIMNDVIAIKPKTLWLQLGIRNDEAVRKAEESGINVIQDTCIAVTYNRCF